MEWEKKIVLWSEAAVGVAVSLWAGLPWAVQTLMILNVLDLIGGYIVAAIAKDASSKPMFKGIVKKLYLWLLVGATYQLWGKAQPEVTSLAVGFYAVWEFKSLTEKAALLGIPIPGPLRRSMRVMQEKYEGATGADAAGTGTTSQSHQQKEGQ